jgi:ribosomal protein S27AE
MSPLRKAQLYAVWVVALGILSAFLLDYFGRHFGIVGTSFVVAVWLSHGIVLLFIFKCTKCGASIFTGSGNRSLWKTDRVSWPPQQIIPRRICPNCGHDHGQ